MSDLHHRARRQLTLGAALLALAGCADQRTLIFEIDAELTVPDEIDTISVKAVASQSLEDRHFCSQPFERTFNLIGDDAAELPVTIALDAGELYDGRVVVQATGLQGGIEQTWLEVSRTWPTDGAAIVPMTLTRCEDSCGSNEHCWESSCEGVPVPGAFDASASTSAPCASD